LVEKALTSTMVRLHRDPPPSCRRTPGRRRPPGSRRAHPGNQQDGGPTGSLVGGWLGARLGRRLPPTVFRTLIVVFGWVVGLRLLLA
jgi:hypothetical protein